jgi:hypothetical protein
VFEQDFDVAVSWRKSSHMPINGGLLILNNRRPEKARKFFDDYVTVYREKYIDSACWYGDQLALRDVCGVTHHEMGDRNLIEVNGYKILFLPCNRYNFSPEESYTAILKPISDSVILHFKGSRKRFMEPYWLAHLQLRQRSSLLRWVSSFMMRKSLAWKAADEMHVMTEGNDR